MTSHLRCLIFSIGFGFSAAAANWHVQESEFRRELQVEKGFAGVASVTTTFFIPATRSEQLGIRLIDSSGTPRPVKILDRLGGRVTLYFNGHAGETLYAYFAPPAALPESAPPALLSGLLRETRAFGGHTIHSLDEFERAWRTATPAGARFEQRIFSSYNPFGENAARLHHYSGKIIIPVPGDYTFCVATTDAGFLLINGRLVAQWPGNHSVSSGLDGSKRGTVSLKKGIQTLDFLHANCGPSSFAVAAFIPPGEKQHVVIPATCFTAVQYAYVGKLEKRAAANTLDFTWENTYMLRFGDDELYQLNFSATAGDKDAKLIWDFGDGVTDRGTSVSHYYFKRGDYTVSARLADKSHGASLSQRITIRPRYGQNDNDDRTALNHLQAAVHQESRCGIQPEGYACICQGYLYLLKTREAVNFVPKALSKADNIPQDKLFPLFYRMAFEAQKVDEHYDLAEECFQAAIKYLKNPYSRAKATLHYAGLLNHCLDHPGKAKTVLMSIDTKDLKSSDDRRIYHIYQADCALILDSPDKARQLYESAGQMEQFITNGTLDRKKAFAADNRFFALKNLLAQNLFPEALREINLITWYSPVEKMSPYLNLLKTEALVGNGQTRKAMICLERALISDNDETYRPKLRLELARLSLKTGQFAKAKTQISLIRKNFPFSPEEIQARELLDQIDAVILRK